MMLGQSSAIMTQGTLVCKLITLPNQLKTFPQRQGKLHDCVHPKLTSMDFWFAQFRENKRSNKHSRATNSRPGCQWRQVHWKLLLLAGGGPGGTGAAGGPSQEMVGDVTAALELPTPHQPKQRDPATKRERWRRRLFSSLYPLAWSSDWHQVAARETENKPILASVHFIHTLSGKPHSSALSRCRHNARGDPLPVQD